MKTLVESTVPRRSSPTGRRAAVKTLGCKINVYESNIISQRLIRDHWTMVDPSQEADLYVINSCTVTREADRQTRQEIRRVLRRNPSAKVVVTGFNFLPIKIARFAVDEDNLSNESCVESVSFPRESAFNLADSIVASKKACFFSASVRLLEVLFSFLA